MFHLFVQLIATPRWPSVIEGMRFHLFNFIAEEVRPLMYGEPNNTSIICPRVVGLEVHSY